MPPIHWTCPYCDRDTLLNADFSSTVSVARLPRISAEGYRELETMFIVCPNPQCGRFTLRARLFEIAEHEGASRQYFSRVTMLREWNLVPSSRARVFPADVVPKAVLADYAEACEIKDASPKAAATLARRALQGMIRDFWKIKVRSGKLVEEIDELKGKVEPEVWDAIEAVRKVGNIGAHMEQDVNLIIDVEPEEADKLIALIEMLIKEWYINREQRQARLASVKAVAAAKAAAKQPSAPAAAGGTVPAAAGGSKPPGTP